MSVSVVVVTVAPHVKMTRHQRRCGLNSCYVTRLTRLSLCVCSRLSISQVGPICESSPGSSGSDRSKAGDNRFVSAVLDSHWEAVKSNQVGLGQGHVKVKVRSNFTSKCCLDFPKWEKLSLTKKEGKSGPYGINIILTRQMFYNYYYKTQWIMKNTCCLWNHDVLCFSCFFISS